VEGNNNVHLFVFGWGVGDQKIGSASHVELARPFARLFYLHTSNMVETNSPLANGGPQNGTVSLKTILSEDHELLEDHPALNGPEAKGWDEETVDRREEGYCVECEG
jgi:hypothetical protein